MLNSNLLRSHWIVLISLCMALACIWLIDGVTTYVNGKSILVGDGESVIDPNLNKYQDRKGKKREEALKKNGGNDQSEAAVKRGLAWLARHQQKDGSWSQSALTGGTHALCIDESCQSAGQNYQVAQTGLALLAFLAGGHFDFDKEEYSPNVARGLQWLVENQKENGGWYTHDDSYFMYEHGLATFAMAEACAVAKAFGKKPKPEVQMAAQRGVDYILKLQHEDGGWRYSRNTSEASDTSVSGWQVLALMSARSAGLNTSVDCIDRAAGFFDKCANLKDGTTGYQAGSGLISQATTGVGLIVQHSIKDSPDESFTELAAIKLNEAANAKAPVDYYLWYNGTLGMFLHGGKSWEEWNSITRNRLIDLQVREEKSCRDGSWEATDQWSGLGGRIYSTSLAVLTLEVYYRYAKKQADKVKTL